MSSPPLRLEDLTAYDPSIELTPDEAAAVREALSSQGDPSEEALLRYQEIQDTGLKYIPRGKRNPMEYFLFKKPHEILARQHPTCVMYVRGEHYRTRTGATKFEAHEIEDVIVKKETIPLIFSSDRSLNGTVSANRNSKRVFLSTRDIFLRGD